MEFDRVGQDGGGGVWGVAGEEGDGELESGWVWLGFGFGLRLRMGRYGRWFGWKGGNKGCGCGGMG